MTSPPLNHAADVASLVRCLEEAASTTLAATDPGKECLSQAEVNGRLVRSIDQLAIRVFELAETVAAITNWQRSETEFAWEDRIRRDLKLEQDKRERRQLLDRIAKLETRLQELEFPDSDGSRNGSAEVLRPALDASEYLAFEEVFRGSRDVIRERQRRYAERFRGCQSVLDLGCGRGEFLDLADEFDFQVIGVDLNDQMVEVCRSQGHDARYGDCVEFLTEWRDESLDGIFSAQLVEHLSPQKLRAIVEQSARTLTPGGKIVLETVNPTCPVALGEFYLDPTHVRPIPSRLLGYLLKQAGLQILSYSFTGPTRPDLPLAVEIAHPWSNEACEYRDYAVIAMKPVESPVDSSNSTPWWPPA